jgi:hypothetical protein
MMEACYFEVLRIILSHLKHLTHPWAVTGSLGLFLQGVEVDVHDIDLQSTKEGVFEIERALEDYVVHRVEYLESKKIRSFFGELNIDGIKVEIMGDVQKDIGSGWTPPSDLPEWIRSVDVDELSIPVLDLELEYEAYQMLGRGEKAEKIRIALDIREDVDPKGKSAHSQI